MHIHTIDKQYLIHELRLKRWQGQVIICINQTRWCVDVEKTIKDGPAGIGLDGYYIHIYLKIEYKCIN